MSVRKDDFVSLLAAAILLLGLATNSALLLLGLSLGALSVLLVTRARVWSRATLLTVSAAVLVAGFTGFVLTIH